ncbi:YjbH domain-containing protein [Persicitalea jodogahamensis]|uniref:YjbH domain-containing protein n=1 Tax=Persicitalea jodogahamensis TaxID=402147 RepID=UPI0016747413|nr:YjbH domain-containing protein [Persicitalea jodogahamensis]
MNLSGKPGLLYVPTADSTPEGHLTFGAVYNPKGYALSRLDRNAEAIMFANLTILPRLDINISVLKAINNAEHPVIKDLGDRQLDIKYLLLKEKEKRPSLAIILSSPFTVDAAMLTHVLVATKNFALDARWKIQATAGVGSPYFVYRNASVTNNASVFSSFKWQRKSEYFHNNGYLVGVFGGAKLDFQDKAGLMVEFDSRRLNAGGYVKLFERWVVQGGLINLDQFTFGTAYSFALAKPSRRLKKIYEENR